MFVANIGDAKAVVARSSAADGFKNTLDGVTPLKAIVLTREHKAIYPQERARIQKVRSMSMGIVESNIPHSRRVFHESDVIKSIADL